MTTNPPEQPQDSTGAPTPPSFSKPASDAPQPAPSYGTPPAYGTPPGPDYGTPPAPGYAPAPAAPLSDADQRLWATLAHIGGIILGFIAPLVIWLVFKDRGHFVEQEAKESLNFQITLVIAAFAVTIITVVTLGLGSILFLAFIAALVFMIMGAVSANKGVAYRYPLNIRFVK